MSEIYRKQLDRPLHGLRQLLNIKELAKTLGISLAKARTLSHLWGLPFVKIDRAVRFDPKTVLEWLDTLEEHGVDWRTPMKPGDVTKLRRWPREYRGHVWR